MYKFSNNNSNNNFKANGSTRQIPHFRIDDEDDIYKKYELGKKLGQVYYYFVYIIIYSKALETFLTRILFIFFFSVSSGKFWCCLRNNKQRNRRKICNQNYKQRKVWK